MELSIEGPGPAVPRRPCGNELISFVFIGGAIDILPVLLADGMGRPAADSDYLPESSYNCEVQGMRVWVLTAFWGTLFHLAVSPFNWIDKVMKDVAHRVGRMLDEEAGREPEGEEAANKPNLEGLKKKYLWLLNGHQDKKPASFPKKADLDYTIILFEDKNTHV
jgi:hypothetical protein